jgi:hypothetical protein
VLSSITKWLPLKWRLVREDHMLQAYPLTFNTIHGQVVLQHLIDTVYCQIYEGTDPIALAIHNGQRSVVHGILENIDRAASPAKYEVINYIGGVNGPAA